jgi:hypothetical protein
VRFHKVIDGIQALGIDGVIGTQFLQVSFEFPFQINEHNLFLESVFPILIPGVDLKGEQYSDNDQDDFPDGIGQVSKQLVFGQQPLSYAAEKFEHDYESGLRYTISAGIEVRAYSKKSI